MAELEKQKAIEEKNEEIARLTAQLMQIAAESQQ